MQNNKISKSFIISLTLAVIFVFTRSFLLFFDYDFEAGFFTHRILATLFYVVLLLTCAFLYYSKKNMPINIKFSETKRNLNVFIYAVLSLLFLVLTYLNINQSTSLSPLESVSYYVCVISGIVSFIYYLLQIFTKNSFVALLNIAPTLFFISSIITGFINMTAHANTYNCFSGILALIGLAFFILEDGKTKITKDNKNLYCVILIAIILISQSVIPDILTFNKDSISVTEGIFVALKTTYLVQLLINSLSMIKINEDK